MVTFLIWFGVWVLVGAVALLVFDAVTGRLRKNLHDAILDIRIRSLGGWGMLDRRIALVLTAMAALTFWPVVFVGALLDTVPAHKEK